MKSLMSLLILLSLNQSLASQTLELEVGEQKAIKVGDTSGVVITNPKIAKLLLHGSTIDVVAKSPGLGEIKAGKTLIKLTVFSQKLAELRTEVAIWVKKVYGIKLETRSDKIILKGTAYRIQDWLHLQKLRGSYGKLVENKTELSPELIPRLEEAINKSIKDRAFSSVRARSVQGHIQLLTYTKNKAEIVALRELADEWGVDLSTASQAVELKPMVEIEIVIAEIKKTFNGIPRNSNSGNLFSHYYSCGRFEFSGHYF